MAQNSNSEQVLPLNPGGQMQLLNYYTEIWKINWGKFNIRNLLEIVPGDGAIAAVETRIVTAIVLKQGSCWHRRCAGRAQGVE